MSLLIALILLDTSVLAPVNASRLTAKVVCHIACIYGQILKEINNENVNPGILHRDERLSAVCAFQEPA
jgi:hypothetical protein